VNAIDVANMQYEYRKPVVPSALQGSGAKIASSKPIDRSSDLYEQCAQFESIFVKMMLKEMKKTVGEGGLIDGGYAEDIFEDMLYDEYATSMTKTARFGLADQVYLQLSNNR
jgi:Rod binding domain-containing protein